jgi:F0F1-type ATP synthase membrane subunit b/b'
VSFIVFYFFLNYFCTPRLGQVKGKRRDFGLGREKEAKEEKERNKTGFGKIGKDI